MRFEKENGSFAAALKTLGIGKGDLLTVSSDIKTLLFRMSTEYNVRGKNERNAALNELTDTLQAAVGTEGTLLFPVFSDDLPFSWTCSFQESSRFNHYNDNAVFCRINQ